MIQIDQTDLKEISAPSFRNEIPMGDGNYVAGIIRRGNMEFKLNFKPTLDEQLAKAFVGGQPEDFRVTFPDGQDFTFKGYVSSYSRACPIDGMDELHVSVRPTGPMTMGHTKEKKMMKKVRNRFYVAAPSVTTASEQDQDNIPKNVALAVSSGDRSGKWTRKTVADAIAHAEKILEVNPTQDHVAISQIVKIVRRKRAPIVVENVRG